VAAADVTPEQAAKNIRSKAEADLDAAHKHLKVTTDGSAPKAIAPVDHYATDGHKTPLDIAKERLGPNATKAQINVYASNIMADNQLPGKLKNPLPEGNIKLPGQGADGSIYYRADGATYRDWADGSNQMIKDDGTGYVNIRNAKSEVSFEWNTKDKE